MLPTSFILAFYAVPYTISYFSMSCHAMSCHINSCLPIPTHFMPSNTNSYPPQHQPIIIYHTKQLYYLTCHIPPYDLANPILAPSYLGILFCIPWLTYTIELGIYYWHILLCSIPCLHRPLAYVCYLSTSSHVMQTLSCQPSSSL